MKLPSIYKMLLVLGFCMTCNPVYAHGIKYSLGSGGVVVQSFFDNSAPAKGLSVYIFAPGSSEKFQTGKTDLNGCFVFFPDRPGKWQVLVFDQMGHRLEIDVAINEHLVLKKNENADNGGLSSLPRYEKAIMGLCVVFGLFGLFSLSKRKRG